MSYDKNRRTESGNWNNNNNNYNVKKYENNNNNGYNSNITEQLINYIYSTVEISRYKYKIIEYESDLTILTKHKHYVSANFNGTNCLLVFTKIRDRYYSFMVDRKTLTYNINQIKFENIKIIPVNIRLDNNIYNGTILDGIYIYDKKTRNKVFVINDIYYFMGKDMTSDNIQHKYMNITTYLEMNLKNDDRVNNIKISINKLYDPTEILKLNQDMEKLKSFEFKGYAFYPDKSGTKLIFLNNDSKQPVNKMVNQILDENETPSNSITEKKISKKKKYTYVCKTDDEIYATLELRKTDSPDVYNIFCAEREIIEGKKCLKLKNLGIALIPNKNCSTKCKTIFSSKINGKALIKCKFHSDKNKWIPLEEDKTSKYPELLSNIEKNLEIILDSDSEEDTD